MISTAIKSTPAATSELAIAAVNGMIGQAGQGKIVKVLNIDVREINGEYIAVATIQIGGLDDVKANDEDLHPVLSSEMLIGEAGELSEKVKTDFKEAEAVFAYNVDPREITTERLADKPLEDMNEAELRALKTEVEQKLKETVPEHAPAADDSQTPGIAA